MKNNREKNRVIFDYLSNNTEMVIQFDKKKLINSWNQKNNKTNKKKRYQKFLEKYQILKLENIS